MIDLAQYRRFFAEEIEAVAKLQTPGLVEALATVPREQFLRPGPWNVLADSDFMSGTARTRTTPDADPRRVYHNIVVAIDPARQLFNGQPSTLTVWIDALALKPGARVLHIGCGLGYYAAILAQAVGPSGRVIAYEVDEALVAEARQNLAFLSWVDVRHGDASRILDERVGTGLRILDERAGAGPREHDEYAAILVNAGVTHPLDVWLDALAVGGRMIVPLTGMMPAMGSNIGKGLVWLLTKQDDGSFAARVIAMVAIFSALGVRDERLNQRLGEAMLSGPGRWTAVKRLRRDAHDASPSCWFHADRCCLSLA
jgi:protein-L-isoaspartate(D-aspartate) O-methyltransferase